MASGLRSRLSVLWSEVALYKYASHTLQVPEACKVGHQHAFFVAMALQDHGYVDLVDKLHLMTQMLMMHHVLCSGL